jgi:peptidylprolyl isomerase
LIGSGPTAESGDYVLAHYTGWLYEDGQRGEMFESSRDRGEPLLFRLDRGKVLQGWDQGLKGVRVGGKRRLVIPSDLAYGQRGTGRIPPDATLMFEIEVLEVPQVQAEILTEGTGPLAEEGDIVELHILGWIDEDGQAGRKIQDTIEDNQPFQFSVGMEQTIAGLDMGVLGMRVGEKRRLVLPPRLAYGSRGIRRGGRVIVPENATLIFEVELLEVMGKS